MARGYKEENEAFRPNPIDRTGSAQTDGIGTHFADYQHLAGVFRKQDIRAHLTAKRALDPEDNGVAESHVTLPVQPDPEKAKERILANAAKYEEAATPDDYVASSTRRDPSEFFRAAHGDVADEDSGQMAESGDQAPAAEVDQPVYSQEESV